MIIDAKTDILNSGDFLPAAEVAKFAGFSASDPSTQLNEWNRNRDIFTIQHGREEYFPLYALHSDDHRPRKQMAEILRIFGDTKDSWGLAFLFAALNSFLNDKRPRDVLPIDPDRVIAAARDEMLECNMAKPASGTAPEHTATRPLGLLRPQANLLADKETQFPMLLR